ncbi:MAG TPA: EAL domain-containing protein [Candidatus Dormibacteraeota bacterium]|jgi:diguanylate cyclase (GGDEF)-like protein
MTPILRRLGVGFGRRSRVEPRLWIFAAVMLLIGIALWVGYVARLPAFTSPSLPWWAYAIGFFAAARLATIDSPRRGSQSITMAAAPFVIGLFYATPLALLMGYAVGTVLAAATRRSRSLWPTAFDLVRFGVFAAIGVWAFRAIAGSPTLPVWHSGVAAVAATAITVMRRGLSDGILLRPRERDSWVDVASHLRAAFMTAATSMCIGVIAVRLIPVNRLALVPLGVVTFAALMTHRAWVRERYDHEAAEFLIGAVDALAGRQLEPSIVLLLNRARAIFHAEIAQLTVFPSTPNEKAFRTTVRHGRPDEVMVPLALADLDDVLEAETAGVIVRDGSPDDPSAQMLARRGVNEAMVALLRGESRMIGSLMVGGHLDARTFDQRDLRLFRTLATRTTVILENSRMERSIARLTELQEQLTHQAYHDSLTDLANRTLFGQQIDIALQRSAEGSSSVAVIFLDIDDFKGINDTLGHAAGDALLVEVAARIRGCLRKPDTAARLGGDEFALLIEGVDSAVEAEHVARRVLDVLRRPFLVSGSPVTVRASLGIAVADSVDDNAASLMRHADVAMYAAKGSGRDRYVLFAPGMESDVVRRRQLRGELERAMEERQFILHYQPVVNLITGEISAVEALVRWRHPTRGLVLPGEFIHVAEESRLILPLGAFVLRSACETALRLQQEQSPQEPPLAVCVNVSAVQLNATTFVQDVLAIVHEVGLDPATLILELTESMLLEDAALVSAKLEALRRKGIRIAIDDFGTGYSSLSYLRRLPVDILKIAKPFIDDLAGGAAGADEDFTRAIVSLAEALQVQVIAEGIESAMQVMRLLELGCLAGQGFHLCHPLQEAEVQLLIHHGGIDRGRLKAPTQQPANVLTLRSVR